MRATSSSRPTKLVSRALRLVRGVWSQGRRGQSGVAAQYREMDLGQLLGGVDAELVGQRAPDLLVDGERVGLPSHRVQGPDMQGGDVLAQRVFGAEGFEFGQGLGGVAEAQFGVEAIGQRGQAQLVQAGGRRGRERRVGDVGQRRTAPERQGFSQRRARRRGIVGAQGFASGA